MWRRPGRDEELLTFFEPQSAHTRKGGRGECSHQVWWYTAMMSVEEAEAGDDRVEGPACAT